MNTRSEAFSNTLESSSIFSLYAIDSIKGIVQSMGSAYDSIETLGDYFSVVGGLGKVAFGGLWNSF
ncbi:MAG: hypothetical protein Q9M43_10705 [Sulfurimonas sp.]|nr:hypothetical protein [Sulfurimonas sp.]